MTSLTERYVTSTLRTVPAGRREEIAAELRGSIEDMIEDRSAAGQDPGSAERQVLTELGDPAQLAARYADRRLQLIGPRYYLAWRRLLTLLLSFIPAIVGLVVGVVEATDGDNAAGAVGAGVSAALQTAVQITFWTTLVFAVLERTNTPLDVPEWTVDRLPEDRSDRQITLASAVTSIVGVALLIVYLLLQHLWSFIPARDGGNLPLLDPALWSFWLPYLIGVLVLTMVLEFAKYRAGRWTWPLVAGNALLDLAFAAPVIWLLLSRQLLNPEMIARFPWLGQADHLDRITTVAVAATALIVAWDMIDSAVKAYRNRD